MDRAEDRSLASDAALEELSEGEQRGLRRARALLRGATAVAAAVVAAALLIAPTHAWPEALRGLGEPALPLLAFASFLVAPWGVWRLGRRLERALITRALRAAASSREPIEAATGGASSSSAVPFGRRGDDRA